MAGSSLGTIFRMTTWGESHGKGVGVVLDGCPAGLPLCERDIQSFLDRRKPGQSRFTTQRSEGDEVEILSGVFEGRTTGTPISMLVRNTDQRSRDYGEIAYSYRPGHADFTFRHPLSGQTACWMRCRRPQGSGQPCRISPAQRRRWRLLSPPSWQAPGS